MIKKKQKQKQNEHIYKPTHVQTAKYRTNGSFQKLPSN